MTTRMTVDYCRPYPGTVVEYDAIGVGSAVKAEYNRLIKDDTVEHVTKDIIQFSPWNAGAAVKDPFENIIPGDEKTPLNKDYFQNFKAQSWWALRGRFYKTYKAVTEGIVYPVDDLVSLDSEMNDLEATIKELAQATHGQSAGLRLKVEKAPDGTKSPNRADAGVQSFNPAVTEDGVVVSGVFSQ